MPHEFLFVLLICLLVNNQCALANNNDNDQIEDGEFKTQDSSKSPIIIRKETFKQVISEPFGGTFVMFYAPWCGHCKRMQSIWNRLAETHNLMRDTLVAKVDCTVDTELCSDQDILSYPTFVFYKKGNPEGDRYQGERSLQAMDHYMTTMSFISDDREYQAYPVESVPTEGGDYVFTPSAQEFKEFISTGFHFVDFYANWCGHCQELAPTWEELGKAYANTHVKISKIDCANHQSLCQEFGIRAYPTLIFFHNGKKIEAYNSDRDVAAFSRFIDNNVERLLKTQGSSAEEDLYKYDDHSATYHEVAGQVIELTTKNMDKALKRPGLLFVKFFAPWCGHCKAMAPAWIDLARHYEGNSNVRIAEVDCTNNNELCMNHNINAYPTLILFRNGQQWKEYSQSRSLTNLISFIESGVRDEL